MRVERSTAVLPESGPLAPRELEPAAVRDKCSAGPKLAGGRPHMQVRAAGPQAHTGELPQPRPERLLRGPAAPVADPGSLDPHGAPGPALGHLVRLTRPVHARATGGGPYHLFLSASWRIVLSRLRSATNPFNLRFSSRSWRSSRSSLTPRAPKRFFQRYKLCSLKRPACGRSPRPGCRLPPGAAPSRSAHR